MEPIQRCPRRSSEHLGPGSDGEDRISALHDDMLLLVLAHLGCLRAAARTGVLSRRWYGLWAILRQIVICDVPFPSLEAVLGRVSRPPPGLGLSLLDIRVPDEKPRPDAAGVTSLLSAAALLEPKELALTLPSRLCCNSSPMFFLQLPADVKFPALETLSLSGCHVRFDSFLPWCPLLRVLRVKFSDHGHHEDGITFMSVHSASLQELFVEAEEVRTDIVDLAVPELKQLTVSLRAYNEVNISILATMVENISWQWLYSSINFGIWRILKLRLQTARRHGELTSLHIHARITSSVVFGDTKNSTQEIKKHLIAEFSALELHLKTKGHVYGAFVFHLLGMNPCFRRTQRFRVILQRSALKQECPLDCACDHLDWRSQTISLIGLEEVEINGFEGYGHEMDFLKLVFKCAPMLKQMTVVMSLAALSIDTCTQLHNIFGAYSSVICYLSITHEWIHASFAARLIMDGCQTCAKNHNDNFGSLFI